MSESSTTGSEQNVQKNNPLHGITLKQVVTELEAEYGWQELATHIDIRCFKSDPSIKSSLKFLRQTPWAREKVEGLWIRLQESKKVWRSPA